MWGDLLALALTVIAGTLAIPAVLAGLAALRWFPPFKFSALGRTWAIGNRSELPTMFIKEFRRVGPGPIDVVSYSRGTSFNQFIPTAAAAVVVIINTAAAPVVRQDYSFYFSVAHDKDGHA